VVPAAGNHSARSAGHPSTATGPLHGHAFAAVTSDAELLGAAVPYLERGLRDGNVVAVSAAPETVELIAAELGAPGRHQLRLDGAISLRGARPPDAMTGFTRYVDEANSRGVRFCGLAEVDFGLEPEDWREGERWESAFNRLASGMQAAALCLYDRRRLPSAVVESAVATHPLTVEDGDWAANPRFRDPAEFVPSLPRPREPLEDGTPVLVVDDAPRLAELRHQLAAVISAYTRDSEQQEDLRLAAAEIAANAFRHGRPPVSARVWTDGRRMICEVTDGGTSFYDPFAGFVPAHGPDLGRGGMGLWLARKLWDHVDLIRHPGGFTVRLSTLLR
jgi:anti-sigma regulatory factor (Ser/Thr protein kinase)